MKRQKNGDDGATKVEDTPMVRKKNKRVVEKVEEEAKNGVQLALAVAAAADECWLGWEWPLLRREIVDEEMSWGYFSLPIWGVEFMAEPYTSLFSDVVWDDDIWNLKSIQDVPLNF